MRFCVPLYPVTWISLCNFYPLPIGNGLFTPINAFYNWILSSAKLGCRCPKTVIMYSFSGYRFRSFNAATTDPMPLDTILSQSKRIFLIRTLQHPLQTTRSHECFLILPVLFSFLFILPRPLTFRLWCGSYINQVVPSILLFPKPFFVLFPCYSCFLRDTFSNLFASFWSWPSLSAFSF